MSADWPEFQLSEKCTIKSSTRIFKKEYVETGVPFMRSKDVIDKALGVFSHFELFISKERFQEIKNKYGFPKKGDLLISSVGNRSGWPYIVQDEGDFYFKDGNVIWMSEFDDLDPDFLAYWMKSDIGQSALASIMIGSAQKAITIDSLRKLWVRFPPFEYQQRSSDILKLLDKQIAGNKATNQTLEQIAQAIFKSWFVDFDPVKAKIETLAQGGSADDAELAAMRVISAKTVDELNSLKASNPEAFNKLAQTAALFPSAMQDSELGEIPEGWEVGKLANIIDFNPRRTLKKGTLAPYLDMKNVPTTGHLAIGVVDREMASGTKFVNGDTLLARITPCLENGKTAYVDFLKDNQVGWGSTEYIVMRPKEGYPTSVGYLLARDTNFRQQAIQTMTGTSGRQRADAKALAETAWLIYPKELVRAFDKTAKGYLSLAKINGDESKSLSEIRDALLPKLLSGELVGE
ncbi:restriction endonuclease subunit S [Vibrio vulnificus]|nr:restriction endonuclease subunit S [Vibrio vulnificus]EKO5169690.1 restriction endonuclease subunit S [Vibrio vulnificus]